MQRSGNGEEALTLKVSRWASGVRMLHDRANYTGNTLANATATSMTGAQQ